MTRTASSPAIRGKSWPGPARQRPPGGAAGAGGHGRCARGWRHRPLRADTRLIRKDGEITSVRLTGSAIRPPDGQPYLAIYVEDRTAAEAARAEIGRLERELVHAHRLESLGQLVGGIAHDFNNLLAVIGNYASLVRDEVSAAEADESATRWEPVRRDVQQIEAAADRARQADHAPAGVRPAGAGQRGAEPMSAGWSAMSCGCSGGCWASRSASLPQPGPGLWPVLADPGSSSRPSSVSR